MNRKFPLLVLALSLTLVLVGCSKPKTSVPASPEKEVVPVASVPETTEPTVETPEATPDPEVSSPTESEPPAPVVEDTTQMELILDASGSMWGQVEGKAKIDVAKEAMGQIIDDLKTKESLEVALRIYAHQNKECTNSVVEMPMGKIQADAMKAKVMGINPLGMTPIYYSLTESVKDFKKDQSGEKIVVLVTDGLESCNGDPCAAAKALRDGGVVSKIHVVGFGLTKAELETLKCIAEPSDGLVVGAGNATEFLGAMQEILKKSLDYNLVLNGTTAKDEGVPMTVKVTQNGKEIVQRSGVHIQLMLPAGSYDVEARSNEGLGTVTLSAIAVKEDEETEKDVIFAKSGINVKVVGADGKPLSTQSLCVFRSGEATNPVKCAGSLRSDEQFKLLPGTYDLQAVNSGTKDSAWEKGIKVEDGDIVEKTISFAQGTIKVSNVGSDGKLVSTEIICLYLPGTTDKSHKCGGSLRNPAEFQVAPGAYDIKSKNGGTKEEQWVKGVEVKASGKTEEKVTFLQGSLNVTTLGSDGKPKSPDNICVFKQGETEKPVGCAGSLRSKGEFKLLPGTYDIRVTTRNPNAEKWLKGIEVKDLDIINKEIGI